MIVVRRVRFDRSIAMLCLLFCLVGVACSFLFVLRMGEIEAMIRGQFGTFFQADYDLIRNSQDVGGLSALILVVVGLGVLAMRLCRQYPVSVNHLSLGVVGMVFMLFEMIEFRLAATFLSTVLQKGRIILSESRLEFLNSQYHQFNGATSAVTVFFGLLLVASLTMYVTRKNEGGI